MNYDKNAFIAGIAVGRQLKGWATERINSNGEISLGMEVGAQTVIVLDSALALPVAGFDQTVTAVAVISTSRIEVDLGEIAPPVSGFGDEVITYTIAKTPPTREDSMVVASPTLDGSITATATLEVIR